MHERGVRHAAGGHGERGREDGTFFTAGDQGRKQRVVVRSAARRRAASSLGRQQERLPGITGQGHRRKRGQSQAVGLLSGGAGRGFHLFGLLGRGFRRGFL